jgi:hypothetical protein
MDETKAVKLAKILDGEAWQSGGDIWLVLIRKGDGKLAVISDDAICEYGSEEDFEQAKASKSILLA